MFFLFEDTSRSAIRGMARRRGQLDPCRGAGPSVLRGLDYRDAGFHRRQRREIRVGSSLVPVGHRKEIVAAIVGVAVLHGVLEIALKGYRVVAMPAVAAVTAAGAFGIRDQRRAVHGMSEGLGAVAPSEVPTPQEIVFRAGAGDRGLRLIVDEDHVVAFAPPAVGVLEDA